MSFVMLMLGMHQDYQQRVYEELQPLLAEGRDVIQSDLGDLKYLDMFIKETMRVFPVVPFMTRTTTADIQIGWWKKRTYFNNRYIFSITRSFTITLY